MRGASIRRRHHEDEEESAFVSMTDMTVGFLFIVILLLAFFASQYNKDDVVPRHQYDMALSERDEALVRVGELEAEISRLEQEINRLTAKNLAKDREIADLKREIERLERELEELKKKQGDPLARYSAASADARRQLILRLVTAVRDDITREKVEGLSVDISAQGDALRFQGEGLFASRQAELTGNSLKIIRLLGDHMRRELPCYSVGTASRIALACNPALALIETVQVEGHADIEGTFDYNLTLSAGRAANALGAMVRGGAAGSTDMLLFQNLLGQPVMAVSAYSFSRPIAPNETEEGRAANRRIDLRFIMYVPPGLEFLPQTVEDIPAIAEKLRHPAQVKAGDNG